MKNKLDQIEGCLANAKHILGELRREDLHRIGQRGVLDCGPTCLIHKCAPCPCGANRPTKKTINPLRKNCYNRLKDKNLKDAADKINELVSKFNELLILK